MIPGTGGPRELLQCGQRERRREEKAPGDRSGQDPDLGGEHSDDDYTI